jgi:anti-sigma B factor antagonist
MLLATTGDDLTSAGLLVSATVGSAGTTTVGLAGELDAGTVEQLTSAVAAALDDPDCRELDLDLGGVTFCDSTGLGALVAARAAARERSVALVLVGPSDPVHRLLQLTGLDQTFSIR